MQKETSDKRLQREDPLLVTQLAFILMNRKCTHTKEKVLWQMPPDLLEYCCPQLT